MLKYQYKNNLKDIMELNSPNGNKNITNIPVCGIQEEIGKVQEQVSSDVIFSVLRDGSLVERFMSILSISKSVDPTPSEMIQGLEIVRKGNQNNDTLH